MSAAPAAPRSRPGDRHKRALAQPPRRRRGSRHAAAWRAGRGRNAAPCGAGRSAPAAGRRGINPSSGAGSRLQRSAAGGADLRHGARRGRPAQHQRPARHGLRQHRLCGPLRRQRARPHRLAHQPAHALRGQPPAAPAGHGRPGPDCVLGRAARPDQKRRGYPVRGATPSDAPTLVRAAPRCALAPPRAPLGRARRCHCSREASPAAWFWPRGPRAPRARIFGLGSFSVCSRFPLPRPAAAGKRSATATW